jgi:hypothetical protein
MGRVTAEHDAPLARTLRNPVMHSEPGGPDDVPDVCLRLVRAAHVEQRLDVHYLRGLCGE